METFSDDASENELNDTNTNTTLCNILDNNRTSPTDFWTTENF